MPVKVKNTKGEVSGIAALAKKMNKNLGGEFVVNRPKGFKQDYERLPTGVYPVDYMLGGGILKGKINNFYGPESSGKSMMAYCALNQAQLDEPDMKQVIIDVEQAYDQEWVENFVGDISKVYVLNAPTAEMYIDQVEAVLKSEDVNLIIVDSLAMLIPENELESSAEKASVGGNSALIGKMLRKITSILTCLKTEERYPTIITINQVRFKIGVMHGDPETQPGGKALFHMASLNLRFYGKDETDKTVNPDQPAYKKISCIVKKKKCNTLARNCEVMMPLLKECPMPIGQVDAWPMMLNRMKHLGMVAKHPTPSKGWVFMGEEGFKTQDDIKELVMKTPESITLHQQLIIRQALRES